MIRNPEKEGLYEVIVDKHVWVDNKDSLYRIWNADEVANFLDSYVHVQIASETDESLVLQVAFDKFVTINHLPLYTLSNLAVLKSVLAARNLLQAA